MTTKEEKIQQIVDSEPKESFQLRRWIVLSAFALYLFIGIPLWFKLTEIYRAPLPSNFIQFLQNHENIDVQIHNKVYLKVIDGLDFPDITQAVQVQVDYELHKLNQDPLNKLIIDWNVTLYDEPPPSEEDHVLILELGTGEGISINEEKRETTLYYTFSSVKNNDLPFFIAQSLLYHLFDEEIKFFQTKNRNIKSINSIQYSPKIHLSFKLLTGDGYPIDWDIKNAIDEYFEPVKYLFKDFVNFTIDSEIIYFTKLNLQNEEEIFLNSNNLSTILDFSDWGVSSNQFSYPTLNFILFFPSESQSPLIFENNDESFLIPQWGSIIFETKSIEPDTFITKEFLFPNFQIFTSELFTLLGLPLHPKTPKIRLDSLIKLTTILNLNQGLNSLSSLLKLSKSLPNISVPKTIQNNVKNSLNSRMETIKLLQSSDFNGALLESIKVLKFSEEAFFDREMVQQAFFPQEHKVAVYLPLLGPLTLMLSFALLRVLMEIKQYNRSKRL